ncbi:hypothetical protein Pla52n_68820 [Stieleria varia]|uniref:Uncharacterized protein n=1 Tax=Stieleria varia TaxID=2528005 RepID=A0A5C5ZQC3_9BACT|nr:hypothetical protein Pla52n_68820 [Stieleria varia]
MANLLRREWSIVQNDVVNKFIDKQTVAFGQAPKIQSSTDRSAKISDDRTVAHAIDKQFRLIIRVPHNRSVIPSADFDPRAFDFDCARPIVQDGDDLA